MKQSKNKSEIFRNRRNPIVLPLLAGLFLAACNDGITDSIPEGGLLPEGGCPVVLTAVVEGATRASSDDAWDGGEPIAVQASAGATADWSKAEVKSYTTTDAEGALRSDNPFWWTTASERRLFRAWYCGDGSSSPKGGNGASVPTKWSVQADQSGVVTLPSGEVKGFQASDFLFAPAVEAGFADHAAVPIRFYHQMAKVVVNISKSEETTDAAQIKSVKIGDGDWVLSAGFTPPADGKTVGTWSTESPEAAKGAITPRKMDAPTDASKYVASYEALVIPQATAGKCIVAIETERGTFSYAAPAQAGPLKAGQVHTYNITVRTSQTQ